MADAEKQPKEHYSVLRNEMGGGPHGLGKNMKQFA